MTAITKDVESQDGEARSARDVEIGGLIDGSTVGAGLVLTGAICTLTAMIDGVNVQAMSFVAPVLVEAWKVPAGAFGMIFSAGLLGIMIGQFLFTPLADRFGRKWLIIAGVAAFGVFSLLTAFATNLNGFLMLRFLGGIGLGGVTPNIIALAAEYSPRRLRATVVTITFGGGFSMGAVVGGFLSSVLIPVYGWPSIFIFGAAAPALLIPILVFGLPESARYLVAAGASSRKVSAALVRVLGQGAGLKDVATFSVAEARMDGFSLKHLFGRALAPTTALLWAIYLVAMLLTYILLSWMPTVLRAEGLPIALAQQAGGVLALGGVIGGIVFGALSDRIGSLPVLVCAYLASGIAIWALGHAGHEAPSVMVISFLAGFGVIGAQTALNAAAAVFYPTPVRATGVGYAMGFGRIGSVLGPTVGGMLIAAHWPPSALFAVSAAPTVVAAALLVALGYARRGLQTN